MAKSTQSIKTAVNLKINNDGIAHLTFDLKGEKVNKVRERKRSGSLSS